MSERTPLNDAAARRQAAAASAARPDGEMAVTSDAAPRSRATRKPFGTKEQKLAYPQRPGYHRHWFNDEPARIQRAQEAGYVHVRDDKGENVHTVVGRGRDGGALIAYLLECPEEWYTEDMAANEADVRDLLDEIKRGRAPGTPSGPDGQARYIPKQGITIREDRR